MIRLYQTLGGEPWCFPPAVIGELTDWQAWNLYILPAVRRARGANESHGPRVRGRPTRLPTREEYVEIGIRLGGKRELLEADYDRQAEQTRQMRAARGKHPAP